jgi:hypothetical protein
MTVGELIDYVEDLAVDNPSILDLPLAGFVIDNEQVIVLEAAE